MRILLAAESSHKPTGYGTMTAEIARRLHESGRCEVAEHASYRATGDQSNVPWRVYPVAPHAEDKDGCRRYNADPHNQFGKFNWEATALDFKPDAVVCWRDPWYEHHIFQSFFRPFYNILYMPTVDAIPQRPEWLGQFQEADALFTYTDWAADALRSRGCVCLRSDASGGRPLRVLTFAG